MVLEKKAQAIQSALGDILANVDWEQWLEFLMEIFAGGNCFPSAAKLVESRDLTPRQKAALGIRIRQEFELRGMGTMRKVAAIRNAVLGELASTNDEELAQAWQEANEAVAP